LNAQTHCYELLFVCSRNRLRRPTAEVVFSAYEGIEAKAAGTSSDAEVPISADLIEWADMVFGMESTHRRRLQQQFGSVVRTKEVIVLGIPDDLSYMDAELIRILKKKVIPHLKGLNPANRA
jgi:predicted protein tyrosine phosphatase